MGQSLKTRIRRDRCLKALACAALVLAPLASGFSQEPERRLILPKAEAPAERIPPLVPGRLAPPPLAAPLRPVDDAKADAAKADKAKVDAELGAFKQKIEAARVDAAKVEAERAQVRAFAALQLRGGIAIANEPTRASSTSAAALNTSEELERLLDQATKVAVDKNRPDLAPPLWQRLLDEGANAFARASVKTAIPLRRTYEVYRPFSNESLRAIVTAGTESVRYYRLHSDGAARALMAREGAEREAALSEVVRRYFLTTVGDDAAFELACRMLERGDFISADQLFERLSLYPDSNLDRDAISVRRAVTQAHLGRTDVAIELANSLHGDLASVKPLLIAEFAKEPSAVGSAAEQPAAMVAPIDAKLLEPAWEFRPPWTLKGIKNSTNNQAIMSGTVNGRPMIFVRQAGGNYVQTTLEDKDIPDIGFSQVASQWRSSGWRPASSPLVVDGRIYLKSESRTVCCDAKTGNVLWMGRPTRFPMDDWARQLAQVAAHGVNVSFPTATYMTGPQPKTMTEIMLFADRLHHAITVSGGRVFAVEGELDTAATRKKVVEAGMQARGFGGPVTRADSRQNELACYDAATGRFLWAAGRGTGLPEGAAVWSKPLVVGSQVLVALGIDSQLGLTALDVETGKSLWSTTLADLGRAAPTIPVGIMIDDGSIYVASGAGTLFSVDRNGGALRWAASYPRLKSSNSAQERRMVMEGQVAERVQIVLDENFVAREDDVLIVAASDSDHIMAFNVTDGSVRWDSPIPPQALNGSLGYVVGVGNGRMHLANNKWLWTVTTKGGRITWDFPLDGACGRGLLAGDALYVPQSSTILALDAAKGSSRSKTEVATPDSEPVGNLVGDGDRILVASAARLMAMKPKVSEPKPMPEEKKPGQEGSER